MNDADKRLQHFQLSYSALFPRGEYCGCELHCTYRMRVLPIYYLSINYTI